MSLDGYISDVHGGFDWIRGHGDKSTDTDDKFSFSDFLEDVDVLVMGSKSYEDVVLTNLDPYENKKILVATSRTLEKRENVEFIHGDICSKVLKLKKEDGKNIWLFGGAQLTDNFIKADIIDEYIIGIIPTILGNGRLLFKENNPKIDLHLERIFVEDGITIITYSKR